MVQETEKKGVLLSVGIDIGTTSTHLVFSRLHLKNHDRLSRVPSPVIGERCVFYRSAIHLTPVSDDGIIDGRSIGELVASEYSRAGVAAADVDCGAVIITGETARLRNAQAVVESVASFAGDFVSASAGPEMESIIAARGSGAVEHSRKTGKTIVNVDIGGGTTNIALIEAGSVSATGCVRLGGRTVILTEDGRVAGSTPAAEPVAEYCRLRERLQSSLRPAEVALSDQPSGDEGSSEKAGAQPLGRPSRDEAETSSRKLTFVAGTELPQASVEEQYKKPKPASRPVESDFLNASRMQDLARGMADVIVASMGVAVDDCLAGAGPAARVKLDRLVENLAIGSRLSVQKPVDEYWLSGGVAELMRSHLEHHLEALDLFRFGDIGCFLAIELERLLTSLQIPFHICKSAIRATVIGSSSYTLQLSGSTVAVSTKHLPLKDLPVVRPLWSDLPPTPDRLADALARALAVSGLDGNATPVALALEWGEELGFDALKQWARAIAAALGDNRLIQPFVVLVSRDLAMALGQLMKRHLPDVELIVIDGLEYSQCDYIDIGSPIGTGLSVPVTVKSLVFERLR